uniref:phenylalanine--tRNA ligase n=1 Tax=Gracilaria salicornia TaxID=172968 RepID=W8DXD5_9FLOR|nr:phenylalanine tRNA synthetase [Gracilaria salicornia]AHH24538.1 phenylalanine tRNA synthetase [Gracilaria salicornia]UAD87690.1 phenylalanine-tRNA ligase beta subunit [Gracilaria salicornia]
MKFSLRWLQEIVDLNGINFNVLAEKLNIAGFEIENIVRDSSANDIIFDLTTTANRQDVLSVVGLAREISCLCNRPLRYKLYKDSMSTDINGFNLSEKVSLLDFSLVHINYLNNTMSPSWLQYYLNSQNIKPLNLLIDISEYICLKWGQCIHVFDKKKITTLQLNYSLFSLQKTDNNLFSKSNVELEVLKYNDLILSVIGFYINPDICCDFLTNSIVIFAQVCNKKYIKDKQKLLNISTDLSKKSLNQGLRSDFVNALYEAIQLVGSFAYGTLGKFYGYHNLCYLPEIIVLEKSKINNILGSVRTNLYVYLTVQEIIQLLESSNFVVAYDQLKGIFKIQVPITRQNDIKRPIDIIEEIGRIYGFDKFVSKLPIIINGNTFINRSFINKIFQVRYLLRYLGLHEVHNYSFYGSCVPHNHNKTQVKVFNPLVQDQSFLRSSLIDHLIINQQSNLKQGNKNIEIFEIGKIFKLNLSSEKCNHTLSSFEFLCLSGLITNSTFLRRSWSHKPESLSWFHAKGILEEFLDRLQVVALWKKINGLNEDSIFCNLMKWLKVDRTAIIYNINHQEMGLFSQLRDCYGISTYIFEFDLIKLINSVKSLNHVDSLILPYSCYPSLTRDISLTLDSFHTIHSVKRQIHDYNNSLVESVEVFNHYKSKSSNCYNVGLRIIYRAFNRTLNYDDINRIDKDIEDLLKKYRLH